jgi:hypothetical protein
MKYNPYSISKIGSYFSCPRKFKFNYIEKVKIDKPKNIALYKGSYKHLLLEKYPNIHNVEFNTNEVFTEEIKEQCYKEVIDFIISDLGEFCLQPQKLIGVEIEFGLDKQLNDCSYYSKDALFRGKIDNVVIQNNTLVLIDYKSGKYKEPQYQSNEQLMLYAIWYFQKLDYIDFIDGYFVYIDKDNGEYKKNQCYFKREHLDTYKTHFLKKIIEIEKSKDFPKNIVEINKVNPETGDKMTLCDWCDFKELCNKE